MTTTGPAAWDQILDPGERILWQGRPDGRVALSPKMLPVMLFGVFFAGFALFWMTSVARSGGDFWMFGLIHFNVGLAIVAAAVFWKPFVHRRTYYTLTTRRAFIAKTLPVRGRTLDAYPLTADTKVTLTDRTPGSVYFARKTSVRKGRTFSTEIGFERVADAAAVHDLVRQIQRGAAPIAT